MVAAGINKEGYRCHFDVASDPFKCQCFDVAMQYFEEILLDGKSPNTAMLLSLQVNHHLFLLAQNLSPRTLVKVT